MRVVPEELQWHPDLASRQVDEQRIVDIAWVPMDARLRNQLITRAYGDIAQEMGRVLGTKNTTWSGFGLWASDTIAGYLSVPIPGLSAVMARSFGDGNRDVFADIGRAHTTFLSTVGAAVLANKDPTAAWHECERQLRIRVHAPAGEPRAGLDPEFWLKPLDPRLEPPGQDHNELLVVGFRAYYRSILADTDQEQAESILLGNCLLALHEQKLLSLAISAGFRGWLRTATTFWRAMENRVTWRNREPGKTRLRIEHWWIHIATRFLVGIALPTRKVTCGKPVPPGQAPVAVAPWDPDPRIRRSAIMELRSDQDILSEMFSVFRVDGRPAQCWNDLADRMAYIIALFAEHQRAPDWLDEYDRPIRPTHSNRFERNLANQIARLEQQARARFAEVPASVASPSSRGELDSLRKKTTHLPIRHIEALELRDAAEAESNENLGDIRYDMKYRHIEAVRTGGVLDPAICRAARATFEKFPTLWFMGLLLRSLPDSYSAAIGVHALGRVSDLASEPFRRAGETAQFVRDLLESDDGWDNGELTYYGDAFVSIVGIRTIHSMVAVWLADDGWPEDTYGVAMNVEDVLGAALTFGVSAIEFIDAIDPTLLNQEERDAYAQFWLGIGFMLGASIESVTTESTSTPGDRLPLTYEQARALALEVRGRHRARTLDGVRLTEALIEGVADGFPRPFSWLAPGLMQTLGNPSVTATLLAGTGQGRRRSQVISAVLTFMLRTRGLRRLTRWFIAIAGRIWIGPFLEQGRTYPYRRPLKPSDQDRLDLAGRDQQLWPVTCPQLEAERSPQNLDPRPGEARRRHRAA